MGCVQVIQMGMLNQESDTNVSNLRGYVSSK